MFRIISALAGLALTLSLAACGGGGDDNTNANTNTNATGALSFSPTRLTATVKAGTSGSLPINVAVIDLSALGSGTLYVYVVDSKQVLSANVELNPVDSTHLVGTLHTSPTLTAGTYEGTFKIQVCLDAGCASQVRGSPYDLAYQITVTP